MKRLILAAFIVSCAGCWPFDFDGALAACADGGLSCGADGGGVADSGTIDAGSNPVDAGSDAGSPGSGRDCPDASIACLDFENLTMSALPPPWFIQQAGDATGMVEHIDTGNCWRIDYAPSLTGRAQFKLAVGVDASVPLLYVRAWANWSRAPDDDLELWSLRASANAQDRMVFSLGSAPSAQAFVYAGYSDAGYVDAQTIKRPAVGTWSCLSGSFAPGSGSLSAQLPGANDLQVVNAGPFANRLNTLTFGGSFANLNDAGVMTVLLDDLAVSEQPLPCP